MPEHRSVMIRRYTLTGDMDDLMRKVDARFAGQLDAAPGTDAPVRLPRASWATRPSGPATTPS
ncbi:hypothetical protein BJF90_19150 [Pseudonocardia sp. CNS-004]|nr:hypothetical protein BJF90_19150 [Pseudonocardia sp. CNS-004]